MKADYFAVFQYLVQLLTDNRHSLNEFFLKEKLSSKNQSERR